MRSWKIWTALLAATTLAAGIAWLAASRYPGSARTFDTGSNGLWVGHRWYTGRDVRTGDPVPEGEVERLADRLRRSGITFVFVHVGPLLADGSIEHSAAPLLSELRSAYPEGRFLAWLGARVETVPLDEPAWRRAAVMQILTLREEGFDGVHFNLEPLRDGEPGYLELLAETRAAVGDDWIVSQATPWAAPLGIFAPLHGSFWSSGFYRATMHFADQTVLMAYNTNLPLEAAYVAFVRDQATSLIDWACRAVRHEILIGIPSYHDDRDPSESNIENVVTAALGVRSALETFPSTPDCFRGVAIYANWVTNDDEWSQLDASWRDTPAAPAP